MNRSRNPGRGRRRRSGVVLFAVLILVGILVTLALAVTNTLSGNNDQDRIERAADILHRFAAEIDTSAGLSPSFFSQVTVFPGKLSHLYTPITGSDRQLCSSAAFYTTSGGTAQVPKWRGPYHLVPIGTSGHNIVPGFFASDQLVRVSATDIAIEITNVALDDAKALQFYVDRNSNNTVGTSKVTYSPTNGSTPVTLRYHTILSGQTCA